MSTFEQPNTQHSFQPRREIFLQTGIETTDVHNVRLENVRYNLLMKLTSKVHVIIDLRKLECR